MIITQSNSERFISICTHGGAPPAAAAAAAAPYVRTM